MLLRRQEPSGPACHTNETSCFHHDLIAGTEAPSAAETARELWDVIVRRMEERPEGSYVSQLFAGGLDRIARKIGEEATEVVIAAKNEDRAEIGREMADLWFHSFVLLAQAGMRPEDVWEELARRRS